MGQEGKLSAHPRAEQDHLELFGDLLLAQRVDPQAGFAAFERSDARS